MIKAKNKLTGETLNFTEKDFKAIQTHFPDMYEYVSEVENSPIGEQELIIEIIKPNGATPPKPTDDEIRKELEKTYQKGWNLKKEFIAPNGDVYKKGKLQK